MLAKKDGKAVGSDYYTELWEAEINKKDNEETLFDKEKGFYNVKVEPRKIFKEIIPPWRKLSQLEQAYQEGVKSGRQRERLHTLEAVVSKFDKHIERCRCFNKCVLEIKEEIEELQKLKEMKEE